MDLMPTMMMGAGAFGVLLLIYFAFAGPSPERAQSRRLSAMRARHGEGAVIAEAQMRKISNAKKNTRADIAFTRLLPNPAQLAKRLAMTGSKWTVGQYGTASAGLAAAVLLLLLLKGAPLLLALFAGLTIGIGLPHKVVSRRIKKRVNKFTVKFPEAIELLVRGLRSGLPITETIAVVGNEVDGPVGDEFRMVTDKMKIGKTLDAALQDTADRLGTPEFQFFVITIAIQRETGGNLAETLANLANVLRQRAQMKLKIKAMSSESKASAYIVGALPFIVFSLIMIINQPYMMQFFTDQRLTVIGLGGLIWMGIGVFIMAKMTSFEI